MKNLESLLETEMTEQISLPLAARFVDLGLDAYMAGYRVAAEQLFHMAEQMMEIPSELQ